MCRNVVDHTSMEVILYILKILHYHTFQLKFFNYSKYLSLLEGKFLNLMSNISLVKSLFACLIRIPVGLLGFGLLGVCI